MKTVSMAQSKTHGITTMFPEDPLAGAQLLSQRAYVQQQLELIQEGRLGSLQHSAA